ncbi:MAG: NADH-quinone oxidoreductase subunit J [Dehalococcoidia bacterium]
MFARLPLPSQFDRIIMTGGLVAGLVMGPILVALIALYMLSRITGGEVIFYLASAVILFGALGAVLLPNLVHSALSLIGTLLGVAAIYLLLLSEFLALVQILVYGGGVIILVVFGLMLTNAQDDPVVTDGSQKPFAFGVGAIICGVFIAASVLGQWGPAEAHLVAFPDFGRRLFGDFGLPIIIIAFLLDIAFTGALVNARRAESAAREEAAQ